LLAARWRRRLGLRGAGILPGGVLSAALTCRRVEDGTMVVLTLSGAHARNARAEAAALTAWGGVGAGALRWASDDGRVMLLDAIQPGVAVLPGAADADARRAGDLLRLLHRLPTDRISSAVSCAARELRWRFERAHQLLDGPSHATVECRNSSRASVGRWAFATSTASRAERDPSCVLRAAFYVVDLVPGSAAANGD
jgi:hypothetical protein